MSSRLNKRSFVHPYRGLMSLGESSENEDEIFAETLRPFNIRENRALVDEYCDYLGLTEEERISLRQIAEAALKKPLPDKWKPCMCRSREFVYYYNFVSSQTQWLHPCDEGALDQVDEARRQRGLREAGDTGAAGASQVRASGVTSPTRTSSLFGTSQAATRFSQTGSSMAMSEDDELALALRLSSEEFSTRSQDAENYEEDADYNYHDDDDDGGDDDKEKLDASPKDHSREHDAAALSMAEEEDFALAIRRSLEECANGEEAKKAKIGQDDEDYSHEYGATASTRAQSTEMPDDVDEEFAFAIRRSLEESASNVKAKQAIDNEDDDDDDEKEVCKAGVPKSEAVAKTEAKGEADAKDDASPVHQVTGNMQSLHLATESATEDYVVVDTERNDGANENDDSSWTAVSDAASTSSDDFVHVDAADNDATSVRSRSSLSTIGRGFNDIVIVDDSASVRSRSSLSTIGRGFNDIVIADDAASVRSSETTRELNREMVMMKLERPNSAAAMSAHDQDGASESGAAKRPRATDSDSGESDGSEFSTRRVRTSVEHSSVRSSSSHSAALLTLEDLVPEDRFEYGEASFDICQDRMALHIQLDELRGRSF